MCYYQVSPGVELSNLYCNYQNMNSSILTLRMSMVGTILRCAWREWWGSDRFRALSPWSHCHTETASIVPTTRSSRFAYKTLLIISHLIRLHTLPLHTSTISGERSAWLWDKSITMIYIHIIRLVSAQNLW